MATSPPGKTHVSRRAMIVGLSIPVLSSAASALSPSHSLASAEKSPSIAREYDSYAGSYNSLDGAAATLPSALGFPALRAAAVGMASGRVLEVACGTGANFPLYEHAPRVQDVVAIDVSEGMLALAEGVREKSRGVKIELAKADVVAGLPFKDGEFDSVVDTFSLCVMGDPLAALSEMRRVLGRASGARALLVEHTLSSVKPLALYQNATAAVIAKTSKGCFWNQDVVSLAETAGFRVLSKQYSLAETVVFLELCRSDAVEAT